MRFLTVIFFNLYIKTNPKELNVLPGCIIDGHNRDNIRYADYTVMVVETKSINKNEVMNP